MTRIHSRSVNCDFCPARFISSGDETFWPLLKAAKDAGWTRFGEKDSCPACTRKVTMPDTLTGSHTNDADAILNRLRLERPALHALIVRMADLLIRKGRDYAGKDMPEISGNLIVSEEIGLPAYVGIWLKAADKWQRLKGFMKTGVLAVEEEDIDQTCLDQANYMLLFILARERAVKANEPSAEKWPAGTTVQWEDHRPANGPRVGAKTFASYGLVDAMDQRARNAAQAGVKSIRRESDFGPGGPYRLVAEMDAYENPGIRDPVQSPTERKWG